MHHTTGNGSTEGPVGVGPDVVAEAMPVSRSLYSLFSVRWLIGGLVAIGLITVGGLAIYSASRTQSTSRTATPATSYDIQDLDLADLAQSGNLNLLTAQSLSINGQLRTNNSIVLAPINQPTTGTVGQLFYDSAANGLSFYDGSSFVGVAGQDDLETFRTELQGVAARIPTIPPIPTIPSDLARLSQANTFTGSSNFNAGLTTNTLAVSGVASLQGSLAVIGTSSLGATTASSLLLTSALAVGSGGTGVTSLSQDSILLGNGTGPISTTSYSGASQCLMSPSSGTGAPIFDTCPGGVGSGVNTLNTLMGNLTIADATTAGTTITLNNATTATRGLASFNAANFTVTGGAVNTIQDIATSANPIFAGVTAASLASGINTNLTLNAAGSGNLFFTGYDCSALTSGGKLTASATGQLLCANDVDTDTNTTYGAGTGLSLTGTTFTTNIRSGFGIQADNNGIALLDTCTTGEVLKRTAGGWACATDTVGGGDGVGATTVGALDGGTANANGATISSTILYLQSASGSSPGLVNTAAQTFAGTKTFNAAVTLGGGATVTGNLTTSGTVNGATISGGTMTATAVNGLSVSGTAIAGTGALAVTSASNTNLTLNAAGTGTLFFTGYDCSALTGGGKLTADAAGQIVCGADGEGADMDTTYTAGNGLSLVGTQFSASARLGYGVQIDSNGIGLLDTCATGEVLKRTAGGWACAADTVGGGDGVGVTTVGTVDSQIKSSNGVVISGSNIYLQTADATSIGLMSTGSQTFAGTKTFNAAVALAGGATVTGNITATTLTGNGSAITSVDAALLGGQAASYYLNASNISSGTLSDTRLTTNVTLQGNTFNGIGQLVQLNGSGQLPALSGTLLTNLNGTSISTGTVADARLSANVALLGATTSNFTGTLQQGGNAVCTTAGNCPGDGAGVTLVGAIDGQTKSVNGAVIVGSSIYLQNADATSVGLVSTGAQTFAGAKTFNAAVVFGGGATVTGNLTASGTINGATISGGTLSGGTFSGGTVSGGSLSATAVNGLSVSGTDITATGALTVASALNSNLTLNAAGTGNVYLTGYDCSGSGGGGKLTVDGTGLLLCAADGGGSGVSISGTATDGALTKFNASGQIMDSGLAESATTLTYSGNAVVNAASGFVGNLLNVSLNGSGRLLVSETGNTTVAGALSVGSNVNIATGSQYRINGIQISSAALSNDSNLAKLDAANVFTNTTTVRPATNSTTALVVQNASSVNVFSVDTTNKSVAVGAPITYDLITYTYSGGSYSSRVDYATGTNPYAVTYGDLDGDGDQDVAVTNAGTTTLSVLKNNGDGSLATKADYTIGGTNSYGIVVADLDADSDRDLVTVSSSANNVSILKNNGDGTFATKVDYATGLTAYDVVAKDLDGDGDQDLAVANFSGSSVSILKNNGNGTFVAKVDYATGVGPLNLTASDLDGDGDQDIIATNSNANTVSILKNNGNGTFVAKVDYATGTYPRAVVAFDLDADGDRDLALVNQSANTVSILKNNGNGTFVAKVDYATGTAPYFLTGGDIDLDGDTDLAITNYSSNTVSILMNNGNAIFAAKVDYATGNGPYGIGLVNMDGDADNDLVVANRNANTVAVMFNALIATPTTTPTPSTASITAANANMSALTLQGASSQVADLLRIQNSSAVPLFVVAKNGKVGIGDVMNLADSVYRLNVEGSAIFNAAVGYTGNLLDLQLTGTSKFKVSETGNVTLAASATFTVGTSTGISSVCTAGQTLNGITVVGGIVTAGTCTTNGADLAESYKSVDALVAGEIVSVDGTNYPGVKRSAGSYDTGLMGVVSTKPHEILGDEDSSNDYPIALVGRVPVKVNGENGAINAGDKITSSSTSGIGMKAERAGMVIGTALTSFDGNGQGAVQVFVHIGYYDPVLENGLQSGTMGLTDLNVSGAATIDKLIVRELNLSGDLTVQGLATVQSIVVKGHVITASGQPTALMIQQVLGASVVVEGTDTTGTITIITGATVAPGELAEIIFSELYDRAPRVVMSPANEAAAGLQYYKGATTAESFRLNVKSFPAANTTYQFDYFIAQ